MDIRERLGNPLLAGKSALEGWQAGIWTALPGIYQGPGTGNGTANVQPAIKGRVRGTDGDWSDEALPLCINCPILWPGGGGFLLTFPLQANVSEGLLVFSSRCIDAWWQQGGVQPQTDHRQHDLSDGFFIPSPCGQKTAPGAGASSSSAQLRSLDGGTYLEMAAGNVINIHASGGINITGDVAVTGKITASGDITAKQGGSSVALSTHKHPGDNLAPTPGT